MTSARCPASAPPRSGFYIVKGAGLPRIDIIGNNQRVDWPRFMSQVADALSNPRKHCG